MAFSSSRKRCSLLVVEVKSATLKQKVEGKFYCVPSINEEQRAKPKSREVSNLAWNQRFIFSVPTGITLDKNSTISFKIFRSRKFLSDSFVGEAANKIEPLFPVTEAGDNEFTDDDYDSSRYNTDSEFDRDDDISDSEERPTRKEDVLELNSSVELPILKDSTIVGSLNICITAWQRCFVFRVLKAARTKVPIFRDHFRLGTLEVKKTERENCVFVVSNDRFAISGWDYDDFLMSKVRKPSKLGKSLVCCGKR